MAEDFDNFEKFEARETAHVLPKGWLILFVGLILWGLYYIGVYTPQVGGWSQAQEYNQSLDK